MNRIRLAIVGVLCVAWLFSGVQQAAAVPPDPAHLEFDDTYRRHDLPVEQDMVTRTWMWGGAIAGGKEVYEETDSGWRSVHYYDKARMEYNPDSDDPLWTVRNGLLAMEMITGEMQIGDDSFISHEPAEVPVVGDHENTGSPTYATLGPLLDAGPHPVGEIISATIDADANLGEDASFRQYGVSAIDVGSPTDHTVASEFWEFMNSSGLIWTERIPVDDGLEDQFEEGRLFPNPFYATGYPITEAYWTRSEVGGELTDVLMQCFERRCLTYTPDNPDGWQVESGNIGFHYYTWRHHDLGYGFAYYGRAFEGLMGAFLYSGYPLNAVIGNDDDYFHVGLRGIETPGPGDCLADEAWGFVVASLNDRDMAFEGSDSGNWDRRAPYRIWLGHGVEGLFNEELVRYGYATVDEDNPDPLFHEQLLDAQRAAQSEDAGVWGECR